MTKKEHARVIFLNFDIPQKEIASKVGVTEATMSGWVNEGNWKEYKDTTFKKNKIVDSLLTKIETLLNDPEEKSADKIVKYASAVNRLKPKGLEVDDVVVILEKMMQYMLNNHQAEEYSFIMKLNKYQNEFVYQYQNNL